MADLTREVIERWLLEVGDKDWTYRDMDRDLNINPSAYATRRQIVKRMCDEGKVIRIGGKYGVFRGVDNVTPILEWQTADITATVPLKLPFNLNKYVNIYPKNVLAIAGSPNAGKTALMLNILKDNMYDFDIDYYTSEMGPEEMKVRLSKFGDIEWKFKAYERSINFADIIHPDRLSLIDYLEVTTDFYAIADEINAIFRKLNKGVAIIAIQKKKEFYTAKGERKTVDLGRGAEFSLEKPRLYLAMDAGRLKIVKAKNWAQHDLNPNGLEWTFQLVGGAKFVNIHQAD